MHNGRACTTRRVLQNIVSFTGLFCRILSLLQGSFAKETLAVLIRYVGVADLCKSGLGVWGGLDE